MKLAKNSFKSNRCLEIGPGIEKLYGFETLDIKPGKNIDYVMDCAKKLPFKNYTFEIIYASHVLEHVPWYMTQHTINEWVRILKKGGSLEIWVPDAVKICKAFIDAEICENNYIHLDGWYKFNSEKDPCVWASGRTYTYGDGQGSEKSPNWHKALFSKRYLKHVMEKAGLTNIRNLTSEEVRGSNHGWINLGLKGRKV